MMKNIAFKRIGNTSKRTLAFILALATVFTLFCVKSPTAAEAATRKGFLTKNGMVLKITTGSKSTDQISYFAIKYRDTSDTIRTHILTPNDNTLRAGFAMVEKYVGNTSASKKKQFLGESGEGKGLGISFKTTTNATALAPMSSTYFYFETYFDFKNIVGINFLANYKDGGNNEIDIQDIAVYKVNRLYDVDMQAGFSNDFYVDFMGKKLMSTKIERPFVWSQTDTIFDFDSLSYSDGSNVDFGRQFYEATYEKNIDTVEETCELDDALKYTIELNLADVYGGGAEFLNSPVLTNGKADLYQGWFREPLVFEVTYQDKAGLTMIQKIPVALGSFYKATTEGGNVTIKSIVSGLMQQGDKLVFDVNLFNASSIDSASFVLKYGRENVKNETGYSYTYTRSNLKVGTSDSIKIRSIIAYENKGTSYSASVATGFLTPTVTGTPVLYFKSYDEKGVDISEESSFSVPFAKATGTEDFSVQQRPGLFLITLKTDTPESASTTDPLNVVIRYKSYNGEERETGIILIQDAVGDYYGYWPSTGGDGNVAYAIGTYKGYDLSFTVELPDVDTFLGMRFALSTTGTDDWQCSAIGIFEVKEFGPRTVKWESVKSNNIFTDRIFSRNCKLENISPTLKGPFLVEPGSPTYVEFDGGTSVVDDNDVNWDDYKYQMSYEEASQNLGFTKERATYNVEVAVSGDIVNGMLNEDCGSKNQFYFKLVFEDGSSGYVLANQQLTSDGFTSGITHEFKITTNRDMGNLSAIKILPENQEESEPFDKLKIDHILVTKSNGEGLALSWRIDIDEWITIDYQDSGAKNSTRGQKGRTENELAQTFKVTSKGYSLNLMFAIETLSYIDSPFEGKLSAYIDYVDSSNALQTKEIDDLTAAFCEYAGKPGEIKTFTPVNDMPTFTGTIINRSYILSPNHTDRFFTTLTDVTEIVRMRLVVQSVTAGRWKVGGVSGYRVLSKGNKILNDNNEYQYNGDVELVCQSSSTIPYDVQYTASGNGQAFTVLFGANKIDVDLSNTWISSISYVPQSNDDSINIYAYMRGDADDIKAYEMKAAATYALADESTRENVAILKADKAKNMFYAKDIKVSGMRTLRRIGLKADSYDPQFAPCEYVIVEHVRSGVVINTYFMDFGGQDMGTSSYYYYVKPGEDTVNERERQTLMFMISQDSQATKIINGSTDLAVCLNYTSTNDPDGKNLTSPNLFLSDYGITTLKPGDIITVSFDQKYVKDITSITFVGQGGVSNSIKVKAARLTTDILGKDGTFESYKNFYSFGNEMQGFVTYSPKNMNVTQTTSKTVTIPSGTQKSVGMLTIGMTTQSGSSGLANGTKIRTKIGYYDDFGMTKETTIDDITKFVVRGTFNPGETAYANILISGISSIRYISVEPYGNTSGSSWALDGITATLSVNSAGITEERRVNKTVVAGTPETIGFGNIKIQVIAYISKPGIEAKERRGYSSGSDISEGILMDLGNDITFNPSVDGSISGITVKCASVGVTASGSQVTSDVTNSVIKKEYDGDMISSFTFTPNVAGDYRITVASQEIPSIAVEINVSVIEKIYYITPTTPVTPVEPEVEETETPEM